MPTVDTLDTLSSQSTTVGSLVPGYTSNTLALSLVFHPDSTRLGEAAILGDIDCLDRVDVGRSAPAFFARGSANGGPLADEHISRRALVIRAVGEGLEINRPPGSSRARVGGRELGDECMSLGRDELLAGVSISLAHGVILLLHLGAAIETDDDAALPGLIGGSTAMRQVRRQLLRLAATDSDVLIRGETGTGKELVARALHEASERASAPWVAVTMAAIPAGLAPALLFGAARGSFTGADRASEGYFRAALGGTLFLDEIGDTPEEVQPQLLRALQEREIQPVGGRMLTLDVRVISATDVEIDSDAGHFRRALLHRLGAAELYLPPLRERREDIAPLLWHFLAIEFEALGRPGLLPGRSSATANTALWAQLFHLFLQYDWPGNVRELANAARAVALATEEHPVLPAGLYRRMQRGIAGKAPAPLEPAVGYRALPDLSEADITEALGQVDYEIAAAARLLGVSRTGLYRRIDRCESLRLPVSIPLGEIQAAIAACDGDEAAAARQLRISVSGLRGRLGRTSLAPRR